MPDPTQNKPDRPLSITIAGWWLIATGILSILGVLGNSGPEVQELWIRMGINPTFAIVNTLATGLAHGIAGFAILRGFSWGRTLYLLYGVFSIGVSLSIFPSTVFTIGFGVFTYLVFAFILIRKPATAFFSGEYVVSEESKEQHKILSKLRVSQRNKSDFNQIIGVLFACASGLVYFVSIMVLAEGSGGIILFVLFFLLTPATISLVIAVFLWGFERWSGLSGWTLLGPGVAGLFCGFAILGMMQTSIWDTVTSQMADPIQFEPLYFLVMGILGLVFTALGGGLLYYQHTKDMALLD